MWIQTGVTVRKRISWVMTSVTLTFDLWPWPSAWTSLMSLIITPENFVTIRWWEHNKKGVTDRRTENNNHRAASSQPKTLPIYTMYKRSSLIYLYQCGNQIHKGNSCPGETPFSYWNRIVCTDQRLSSKMSTRYLTYSFLKTRAGKPDASWPDTW